MTFGRLTAFYIKKMKPGHAFGPSRVISQSNTFNPNTHVGNEGGGRLTGRYPGI